MAKKPKAKPAPTLPPPEPEPEGLGCRCPKCNSGFSRVYYVRKLSTGAIRRRRQCEHCGTFFSTHERRAG